MQVVPLGKALAESEALLDEVWSCAARPEDCMTQRWQVGDLVIWDDRAVAPGSAVTA